MVISDLAPATILGALLLSFLMSTLLPAMHEATHQNISPQSNINRWIGTICGVFLLVDYSLYRRYHLLHHRNLGDHDDPELPVEVSNLWTYVTLLSPRYFLFPFWQIQLSTLFDTYFTRSDTDTPARSSRGDPGVGNAWLVALTVLVVLTFVHPVALLQFYWMPLFFSATWMFFTTVPEHFDDGSSEAETITRTVETNRLLAFFLWNTNYHSTHHDRPALHFAHLPHAAACSSDVQASVCPGYFEFHRRLLRQLLAERSLGRQ